MDAGSPIALTCVIGLLLLPFANPTLYSCHLRVNAKPTPVRFLVSQRAHGELRHGTRCSGFFHLYISLPFVSKPQLCDLPGYQKDFLLIPNVLQVSTSSVDGRTESKLTISKAAVGDRGNYTCRFSYLKR